MIQENYFQIFIQLKFQIFQQNRSFRVVLKNVKYVTAFFMHAYFASTKLSEDC